MSDPVEGLRMGMFEVQSDPWALARLHASEHRQPMVAQGFEPLGVVFTRVDIPSWERAGVGYCTEVLVSDDGFTNCDLDLFFDHSLVTLTTLFSDGSILLTRYRPLEAVVDPIARLTFSSRPGAFRWAENHDEFDATALWERHQERLRQHRERQRAEPVPNGSDLRVYFASHCRGDAVTDATVATAPWVLLVFLLMFGVVLLVLGATVAGWIPFWVGAPMGLVLSVLMGRVDMFEWGSSWTRLPLRPVSELLHDDYVEERLGDNSARSEAVPLD